MKAQERLQLTVESGPCAGASVNLQGRQTVIGRDAGCALCLADDATVSRQHAAVAWEAGQWVLRDLGSKNGTSLERPNGPEPLQSPQSLVAGLVFLVGSARVRVTAIPVEESAPALLRIGLVDGLLQHELRTGAAVVTCAQTPFLDTEVAALQRRLLAVCTAAQGGAGGTEDRAFLDLGRQLAAALLPPPIIAALKGDSTALTLLLDPALLSLAWECLVLEEEPLCLTRPLARQILLENARPPVRTAGRRVLLVANPTGDLAEAQNAAEALLYEMTAIHGLTDVRFLGGRRATAAQVSAALTGCDVALYLGHAAHDPAAPQRGGWALADGLLAAERFAGLAQVPSLVIAAACESARETPATSGRTLLPETAGVAASLLLAGVAQYVGTLWRVPVVSGSTLGAVVLGSLLEGVSLGEALLAARRQVRTELGSPWYVAAGYVHYGTPGWRLPR